MTQTLVDLVLAPQYAEQKAGAGDSGKTFSGHRMFSTTPEMQLWMPPGISSPEETFWGAVMLASDAPWFLLTLWEQEEGDRFQQSMAVAWESTLRRMLEGVEPGRLAGLSRVRRDEEVASRWQLDDVSEVWISYAAPTDAQGTLLFAHSRVEGLFDSHGVQVDPLPSQRHRLASFGMDSST